MRRRRVRTRWCVECGYDATVFGSDELAICPECIATRRTVEIRLMQDSIQAGALHVARERGQFD